MRLEKLSNKDVSDLLNNNEDFFKKKQTDLEFHLRAHFKETGFFSYFPESYSRKFNWRMPFRIAYELRDLIQGKHLCHVGSYCGDLELIFSKYAREITCIEYHHDPYRRLVQKNNEGLYSCQVNPIHGNFIGTDIDADVYFYWMDVTHQPKLYNYILELKQKNKDDKETIIITPCYELLGNCSSENPDREKGKILEYRKTYDHDESAEYYLVPFDEKLDLSFYDSKILTDTKIVAIVDSSSGKDKIYLYDKVEGQLAFREEVDNFDLSNFKEYIPPFLLKGPDHPRDGYTNKLWNEWLQYDSYGYIPLKVKRIHNNDSPMKLTELQETIHNYD